MMLERWDLEHRRILAASDMVKICCMLISPSTMLMDLTENASRDSLAAPNRHRASCVNRLMPALPIPSPSKPLLYPPHVYAAAIADRNRRDLPGTDELETQPVR